jgi:hypothetical protein
MMGLAAAAAAAASDALFTTGAAAMQWVRRAERGGEGRGGEGRGGEVRRGEERRGGKCKKLPETVEGQSRAFALEHGHK